MHAKSVWGQAWTSEWVQSQSATQKLMLGPQPYGQWQVRARSDVSKVRTGTSSLRLPPHMAEKQHVNIWRWKKDQLWAEELLSCWVPQEQLIKETKGHVLSTLCFQQLFQSPQFQHRQQPEMQKMQN